ncbi:surface antigen [Stanieria sp. NIES-3757]|nr:surface antigen [Stanieria sp. NIES-3757]
MQKFCYRLFLIRILILVLGTACTNLLLAINVRGQSFSNSTSALSKDSSFSTKAVDLLLESYKAVLIKNTQFFFEGTVESEQVLAQEQKKQDQVIPPGELVFDVGENFGFGSIIEPPTALNGLTRKGFILPGSSTFNTLPITINFQQKVGDSQRLLMQAIGVDPQLFGVDISYTLAPKSLPGAFSANFIYQSTLNPAFESEDSDRNVTLPQGGDAWVNGIGGGIEYSQNLAPNLDLAAGVNYQRVSVRSGMFSNEIEPVDELDNSLTVSPTGQDDLLTLNLAALYTNVDNPKYPNRGFKAYLDLNQSIPVGEANILSTLLAASLTQFIPFGSGQNPSSLVLNIQGGTILGDAPPYGAFNLGGGNSVRGYDTGGVSTGKSFIQATAEYRIPLFSFDFFKQPNDVLGSLFFDYGTDLGTADEVIGEPAVVRDKPSDGFGYGLGLQWRSPFGLLRLEGGLNDRGDGTIFFGGGSRF